jgi:hypothetical protein
MTRYKIPNFTQSFGAPSGQLNCNQKGEFEPVTAADELEIQASLRAQSDEPLLSANKTIAATDNGKVFQCTVALNITIPAGLTPMPTFVVLPPSSGDVSVVSSGGTLLNGATDTLTRGRASNRAGFVVQAYPEANSYGVSGA